MDILDDLQTANSPSWWSRHGGSYRANLIEPARELAVALRGPLHRRVSTGLRVEPVVGGSILRSWRDARFFGAEPIRPHLEMWFWEGPGTSRGNPGLFVVLGRDGMQVGAGIRRFECELLAAFRAAVDDPRRGRALVGTLHRLSRSGWRDMGPALARVPAPYPADHERERLLRRQGLWSQPDLLPAAAVRDPALVERLVELFRLARPLHRWLVGLRS